MKYFKSYLLIIFLSPSFICFAQIDKRELMKTVEFLTSKELAGRLPGHAGYDKAANFISSELAKLNLKPGGGSKYLGLALLIH